MYEKLNGNAAIDFGFGAPFGNGAKVYQLSIENKQVACCTSVQRADSLFSV